MRRVNRRIAIWLCLCLVIGLLPAHQVRIRAASGLKVKLIIANKNVTKKTYTVKTRKNRQMHVRITNPFGKTTIKYTSNKKSVAKVNKNGFIRTYKPGTARIVVKVTCKSGKKKKSKTTWVKIRVPSIPTPTPTSTASTLPSYSPSAEPSLTPAPVGTSLQAVMLINGTNVKQFPMTILDNASGRALYDSLPKVLNLGDQNKNTKVGYESELIYTMDEFKPSTLLAGDFMLYGTNRYELTYENHQSGYAYTRLGWITNPTGLKEALGSGAVSVTIIKSTLPTLPPSATPTPTGVTPTPSQTPTPTGMTPTPSPTPLPSGVTPTPTPYGWTPTPSPTPTPTGMTPTPTSSVKPSGSPTPTPKPTPYGGARFVVNVANSEFIFPVETGSSAANEFYNDLASGVQVFEMRLHSKENRYYASLTKQYNERQMTTPPSMWPAGSLVLLGNNEITIVLRSMSSENRPSVILGRFDTTLIPEGSSVSGYLSTSFTGDTVTTQFYR